MRKTLTIALLAVFVVGTIGLLAAANAVEIYDGTTEIQGFFASVDDGVYDGLDLSDLDPGDYEKVVVVTPEGIEEGTYEVKNSETEGKVLVIVDPIHVTE